MKLSEKEWRIAITSFLFSYIFSHTVTHIVEMAGVL
jgi:hypothetical protein